MLLNARIELLLRYRNALAMTNSAYPSELRSMRPNIAAYYWRHPQKAFLRLKFVLTDGFSNKYLTIAALSVRDTSDTSGLD